MWLDNWLRALMLLLGILSFLGWGFSGESGAMGLSSLVSTLAILAVAVTPDEALRDRLFRTFWTMLIACGLVAVAFWTWSAFSQPETDRDTQGLIFAFVTALGLLAGLTRLRHATGDPAGES